jgi:hypothetical protein
MILSYTGSTDAALLTCKSFKKAVDTRIQALWDEVFPINVPVEQQNISQYPIIRAWRNKNALVEARRIGELYTSIRSQITALWGEHTGAHLAHIDAQHGRNNLEPAHLQALETALHQAVQDENLMRVWLPLVFALQRTGLPLESLPPMAPESFLNLGTRLVRPPIDPALLRGIRDFLAEPNTQAALNAITELDLSGLSLTAIPDELIQLQSHLVELSLSHNNLTSLPEGFLQNAPDLWNLSLFNNHLAFLPLGFLENSRRLEMLRLSGNNLSSLPARFLENSPIQHLELNNNNLTSLPVGFLENPPQLMFCMLNNNNLNSLPINFLRNAPSLQRLALSDNPFNALPVGFLQEFPLELKMLGLRVNLIEALIPTLPAHFLARHPRVVRASDETNGIIITTPPEEDPQLEEEDAPLLLAEEEPNTSARNCCRCAIL